LEISGSHAVAFYTDSLVGFRAGKPSQIGTSIVNGIMFVVGIDAGIELKSLELASYAAWPLMMATVVALAIALVMRETCPR